MLKTERLLLRQWHRNDFEHFAAMCADKKVMEFFPSTLSHKESVAMAEKIQSLIHNRGWGFWAVEIPEQTPFIGFVGLHIPKSNLPFSPCVEIGWRLSKQFWGKGYATESARKVMSFAFTELNLDELVSFTTVSNLKSQAVMKKIGMSNTQNNFMHPDISSSSSLCEHVLFNIKKSDWLENQKGR